MTKRTPPYPPYPKWTEAKFFSFLRAGLRQKWVRWPPRFEVLKNGRRNKPKSKEGRHRYEYKCSRCKRWWKQTEVEVDHIIPCGSLRSFSDLAGFCSRLFVGVEDLRILCKVCHKKETK